MPEYSHVNFELGGGGAVCALLGVCAGQTFTLKLDTIPGPRQGLSDVLFALGKPSGAVSLSFFFAPVA